MRVVNASPLIHLSRISLRPRNSGTFRPSEFRARSCGHGACAYPKTSGVKFSPWRASETLLARAQEVEHQQRMNR
jgi:hypothetical protein